jgi:alkylated DNA nucleotide flippase Atl1
MSGRNGAKSPSDLAARILLASRLVAPGEWTTYGELGAAAADGGNAARLAARLATNHPAFANAHRVLGSGGRAAGPEADARRRQSRLEAEGVVFNGRSADPARHVGWIALRGRLSEVADRP